MPHSVLTGEDTQAFPGMCIRWRVEDRDLMHVVFTVLDLSTENRVLGGTTEITVGIDGLMTAPMPSSFQGIQHLRTLTALWAWCYRTAYAKVFHMSNPDQLLFK